MIIMDNTNTLIGTNKIVVASVVTIMALMMPATVLAQGRGIRGTQGTQVDRRVDAVLTDDVVVQGRGVGSAVGEEIGDVVGKAVAGSRGMRAVAQKLNRLSERNNNPEVGEQIRTMVQNHEQVQVRTKTALGKMNERSAVVKLMIGPDYKNAGQVRSDVVGLRNDISKLEKIKEEALPEDIEDIQGAVDELQAEADGLEVQLEEQLSGISLFGWLAKMFAK